MGRNLAREVFLMHKAGPPWSCCFCGKDVNGLDELVVHHEDENKDHNDKANLQASHNPCHISHHHKVRTKSQQTRERLSRTHTASPTRGMLGKKQSVSARAAIATARAKQAIGPRSASTKRRIKEGVLAHYERLT